TELAYPWNPGLGTWHHVAYTFDSSTHKLFVDGREVASGANTRVPAYDNTEVRIGADVDTGGLYQFDGKIDEVGFFSRALPASEIAGIYNAGSAGRCKVIPTGVSAVSGSGTYLGTATLTATLGANSSGLPGQTVDFTLNNNSVGSAQTDANGVATLNSVSLTGINAGNYNDAVVATFAGDATYGTSTANGTLSVSKADQMITIDSVTHAPASADYNSQFNVAATSDSGLTVAFSSSGSCSNTGAQFTMTSGTGQCTVKYDQAGNTNYNAAPQKTETVNAQKLNQTITVNTHAPANANYNSQFNVAATASSGLAVTFSNSGVCSNAAAQFTMTSGTGQCTVNYDQAGNANYNAAPQIGETVNAQKLNQTITFNPNPLPDKTFGDADFGVSASSDANLTVSFSAGVNDKCTVTTGTVHLTGAGSCTITASQAGDSNYNSAADVLRPFNIAKGTPIITWSNPADIVYGTALGATQLNATASVAGNNFVYTPASVTVLHAGNRTLHVDFTPDDTTNYNNASKDVTINVTKATLTVTADDKAKTYRAANPALTFAPSGFVNGDTSSILSGSPTLNTTATTTSAVSGYPITIVQGTLSAVHGGFDDYTLSFVNGALTINKTTPVVSWNNPANIVYGTALSGTQLNATATNPNDGSSVAGVFNYSPNGGTVLHVGNSQTLATNFVPTESNNYNTPAQKTAFMNVIPATLTITADNKSRPLNTANPPLTYTPTGFVNGDSASVLTGAPDLNTTAVQNSPIGDYPITITQGNLSASDYTFNFVNGNLAVGKTTPVINWSNPADIVYGTALSGTQLNATATDPGTNAAVPGTFTYTPAAGTVLHVGANQLAMTFTPTDTTNYSPPAQKLVSINVTKATLTITADNKAKTYRAANPALTFTPTGFVNGDTSSVLSGTPTISTTATAISVVSGYPISITQNNLSAVDYTFNFVSGTLTVNKATPVINWSNPSDIVYGTALSGTQLNAGATNPNDGSAVTGAFAYSPIGTTVLHVGNGQTLRADFTPNGVDASSYNLAAQKQVAINVTKATLTITADNKSKAFGAANPALTFTPSGFVNGDSASVLTGAPNLSTTATQSSPVASYPITIAQGTLVATDYSFNFVNGTLTVGKIMPVITWTNPAAIVYGTGLSATQLNATATDPNTNAAVAGIFTYSPAPGSVLHVGNGQSLSVNFAPTDTTNYGPPPAKNVSINVLKATLTITANNTSKSYRAANPASFNFTPSGFVNGDGAAVLSGAPSFSTTATTTSTAGGYPITPGPGTLSASDYGFNFVNGTLTVNPVTPTINWSNPLDIFFGTPLSATQLNATATNPNDNSTVTGAFVYNPAAGAVLNAGSNQTLTANFTPNGSDASSYNSPAAKNVSINISMSVQTINFGNLVNKQVGDAPFTVSATSTSGLPVTFGIVAGPATITGNTVTLTGPGSVTVRAAQIGNGNFNAASSVEQSFLVTSAPGLTPSNGNFVVSYSSTFPGLPSGIFELFPTSRLTRFSALIGFGSSWSPDGTKIAYSQSWKPGAHFHLSMASADGTNTARLDSNEADRELDTNPAWSPDGKSIAYNCDFAGDGNSPLICVRKLTDFWWTVVQEASGPIKVSGQGAPAWSPDSKRLVFSAQEGSIGGGQFALYIYDLTTKAYTRLSHAAGIVPSSQQPFSDMTPAWSPDGTRIVYKSPTGLSIINPDGSNKRDIPNTASTRSPKWSSDMKQVAFIGSALSDPSRQAINVINLDGTNLAEIYSNPSPLFSGLLTFDWQAVPVNVTTPTGNGVIVGDGPGSLRFSNVNTGGTTSVIAITPESAGSMPGGFAIDGSSLAWDVTTTASYTGPVEACFHIYGSNETAAQFNARRVMHGENGVLVDRTSRHDYASGEICATVNSLSPFAVVTNLNPTTTNEIDDQNRFVGQHYLDFLDRPSDPTGQAFWVGTITSCGSDQNCIAVKRINASAAFFMSIEFQQEGYLVERAYKAAYGDTTGTSTLNGDHQMTVPIVRLGQFLDDSAEVGQGVVVNQGNWEQQLNTNKDAFTLDFVQRQGFIDAYPTTLTPIALVNKLFTNTGVTPTANELATAIGRFSGASDSSDTTARAKALRDVAENSTFTKNEMNRAWVLMEYFGYLRRNPNEGQDTDYTGYDFWLTKLNQFNGDFVQAEMVKAFVSSREYRQRFGPN
ncbi:MAG TPA: MBG domain-containing protein, partial [Pyrinomonadaceae bacterium]|nr:MBG domain-containing protein [Pyrinomonadaceae bacterium]